ncbi:conserved hypothetical protein [Aeromonas phage 65]|uniref:Uncharacterized protein n=1 Tax=Aeromonas phage 65 TaxID=2919549 RepID=E5DRT0_9CAUD|nr:hypothetical protein ST65p096 [Aeromonas phage 65]ADQ53104.1 conserved hypothetical protein [Aeromonas phage 65]
MATKIYKEGVAHDATPNIFHNNWHRSVPWVFSKGAWHRAYDIGEENLLSNSRMLNGSDIYMYANNTKIGHVPPCYTIYNNSFNTGNNAFAMYFNQDNENTRGYTFRAIDSRIFFQTRLSLKKDKVYTASVMVRNNDETLVHSGVLADIYMDNGEDSSDYLTFTKKFDDHPLVNNTRTSIYSTFTAKQDCVIQFNFGIGVRYNTNGNFSFDSPQVTTTNKVIDYHPTPQTITNESIIFNRAAGFVANQPLMVANRSHKISGGLILSDSADELTIASKDVGNVSTGIGIDLIKNEFWVKTPDGIYHRSKLKYNIPRSISIGISVWFDVNNGFANNIRLYVNGEVYARITEPYLSLDNGLNTVFGKNGSGIRIEQFEIFLDDVSYLFNISNNGDNKLTSTNGKLELDIEGDVTWWSTVAPKITLQPNMVYIANIGDTVVIDVDAERYDSVEWHDSRGNIVRNQKQLSIGITAETDLSIFYFASFINPYGTVSTRTTRIQLS